MQNTYSTLDLIIAARALNRAVKLYYLTNPKISKLELEEAFERFLMIEGGKRFNANHRAFVIANNY